MLIFEVLDGADIYYYPDEIVHKFFEIDWSPPLFI